MRSLLIILSLLFFVSCQEQSAPVTQKKMAAILTDLHLAEALGQISPIDSGGYMVKNRDSIFTHYQYIFNQHQISKGLFNEALDWYGSNPTLFDQIYDDVLAQLSTIKEKNTIIPPTEVKPADSIEVAKRPVSYER